MEKTCSSRRGAGPGLRSCGAIGFALLALGLEAALHPAGAGSWRVGDRNQPWQLYPVSFLLDAGEVYKPDYLWGGGHGVEVVVDDDGDGLVDEDPVDLVDEDGDGLFNEDPKNGVDDDRDGKVDEDEADLQFDNDGDGLLDEDGLVTGGKIYDPELRTHYAAAPFFRDSTAVAAAANPKGSGYGWGDDDYDSRFNEDPLDGKDNDQDGLVDEDGPGPGDVLPASWVRPVFVYEPGQMSIGERQALAFRWDAARQRYTAERADGEQVEARLEQRRSAPSDWLRPIRLDSSRNVVRIADDRFLSGIFGSNEPLAAEWYGSDLRGTSRQGEAGFGQIVDGNVFTARVLSTNTGSSGFTAELRGLFFIDLLRLRPRPDFPDYTPTSFTIYYAGDKPSHFQQRVSAGELNTRLVVSDFIIPRQVDQVRPVIKEYRFDGGVLGPPKKVQVLVMRSEMPGGQWWELAEFEAYGHGYAQGAAYVTEIIDVGTSTPRLRRYFDPADLARPVAFENIQTRDDNNNSQIDPAELASARLARQFDPEAVGQPVTWGRVRWHGKVEGGGGNVLVRVRAGTSLDTHVYQRKVGSGVFSPFIEKPIVLDWPQPGSRIDAFSYVALQINERARASGLPYNTLSDRDGLAGGWTPWSAPFSFADGLVDRDGGGGVVLPLPPLTRYIQFRFDFESTETSGVSLDYLEFDFAPPIATRGVVAEIFPDTTAQLGWPASFQYVMKPDLETTDLGFNRIDIAVPSPETAIDTLLVDDLVWTQMLPGAPAGLGEAEARVYVDRLRHSRAWLDSAQLSGRTFASAVYLDSASGLTKMGIKTRLLRPADFPRGQDKEIQINFHTPVFKLLTEFQSWIWNDTQQGGAQQPTRPGNATDRLPSDQVGVTVLQAEETLSLRRIAPNPFTPNGDGINDEAVFDFGLFLVTDQVAVEVVIYDLAGQTVRRVGPIAAGAGVQQISWDGRDDAGRPVLPGLYLYRLFVDSDTEKSKAAMGTIGVGY